MAVGQREDCEAVAPEYFHQSRVAGLELRFPLSDLQEAVLALCSPDECDETVHGACERGYPHLAIGRREGGK